MTVEELIKILSNHKPNCQVLIEYSDSFFIPLEKNKIVSNNIIKNDIGISVSHEEDKNQKLALIILR